MIGFVRFTQGGEFPVGPVKLAPVHNDAAHRGGVAVHVLGGGMGDNVRPVLKGPEVCRGGESVVHNQGHAVGMSQIRELLNVGHDQGWVRDGFDENRPGILPKRPPDGVHIVVGVHKGHVNAHAAHGDVQKVEGAPVDGGGGNNVFAGTDDVKQGDEAGRLAGRGEHGAHAAFHGCDFILHRRQGGVCQAGIEETVLFQIEEPSHLFGGFILIGGALVNGQDAGLAVFRLPALLHAFGVKSEFAQGDPLLCIVHSFWQK